jgi:SAM-dependent methyltransferase
MAYGTGRGDAGDRSGTIAALKRAIPWPLRRFSRRLRRRFRALLAGRRSATEVFTRIYAENAWGADRPPPDPGYPYYSGPGSDDALAAPYVTCVNRFVDAHGIRAIVDLGCGDFRIGRRLARPGIAYVGVDLVASLIDANRERFASDSVEFVCRDIVTEDIPDGELCLLREVLQHLSNAQIAAIVPKLRRFRWVILTENHPGPLGSFVPNRDKPAGADTRVLWNSGVDLGAPPFDLGRMELLLSVPAAPAEDPAPVWINTFLIRP